MREFERREEIEGRGPSRGIVELEICISGNFKNRDV